MILVLNADYLPINVTTFKKAYKLIYKGKAEIVEEDMVEIITSFKRFKKPSIIRLYKYIHIPFRKVVITRENIFKRDSYKCAYCKSNKNLTLDHINPKSKGGQNTWENLVTCCFECNSKKGDRTPEQANMELLIKPFKPNPFFFIRHMDGNNEKWKSYLMF